MQKKENMKEDAKKGINLPQKTNSNPFKFKCYDCGRKGHNIANDLIPRKSEKTI